MRYFIEVSYLGTNYRGSQSQKNANTIQGELENALKTFFKKRVELTGSSRTDAGVHALQNFYHFDYPQLIEEKVIYNLNSILPGDITIRSIRQVNKDAHCRFDAISRQYRYYIYTEKDPFLDGRAYYFPYLINLHLLQQAAAVLKQYTDFTSFSKRNTQSRTKECLITESSWEVTKQGFEYQVTANRFLRGMVRALTATMLKVGRGKLSVNEFKEIIESKDCTLASFAAPAHGLFLISVNYPDSIYRLEK